MKVLHLIFVVGSQIALCATVTWAQEGDIDTRQPISIQLFEAVPRTDSSVFRANTDNRFQMQTARWDSVPYHFAPSFEGEVTLPRGYRAVLAGDSSGTSPFLIDNFIVMEFEGHAPLLIGNMEAVVAQGQTPSVVTNSCFNCTPHDADLTPYLSAGSTMSFRASALDYGGIAYIGDVFLVLLPGPGPTVVEFTDPLEHVGEPIHVTITEPLEHVSGRGLITVTVSDPLEHISTAGTGTIVVPETLVFLGRQYEEVDITIGNALEFSGQPSEEIEIFIGSTLLYAGQADERAEIVIDGNLEFEGRPSAKVNLRIESELQFLGLSQPDQ